MRRSFGKSNTPAQHSIKSPGTGKGPSQSASPRSKREGNADPHHHGKSK